MTLPKWLQTVISIGELVLQLDPQTAMIAPLIIGAITAVESIPGATGPQKLSAAVTLVNTGAQIAKDAGVNIDPVAVSSVVANSISDVVLIANIVSGLKTPQAAVASMPVK